MFPFQTPSLQAIRSTGYVSPCKGLLPAVVGWYSFDWHTSNIYSLHSLMSHGSPVVVLFDEKGKIFVYLGRRGKRGLPMLSILSNTTHHL